MTPALEQDLKVLAQDVEDPSTGLALRDAIRSLVWREGRVAVEVVLGYWAEQGHDQIACAIESALLAVDGVEAVSVDVRTEVPSYQVQDGLAPIEGVRNVIAVASGKGGVGKSTVAVNLALALQREGARVGLLDADIYGPSIPRMLGLTGSPQTTSDQMIEPMRAHGLQVMSIGVLVEVDQAMIWRGPMATSALQQMLNQTRWHGLDYLILDLPPGTGDIQLTLAQKIPVAAAVCVTTPQWLAVDDVRRAVAMFNKVNIPVLGVVENMSTYVCSCCGHEEAIFGQGGGEAIAQEMGTELLGRVPLELGLGQSSDQGLSWLDQSPDHPLSMRFGEIARGVAARLARQAQNKKITMPKIKIVE